MSSDEARTRAGLIGRRAKTARIEQGLTLREVGERWAAYEGKKSPYPPMKQWLIEAERRSSIGESELAALSVVLGRPQAYFTEDFVKPKPKQRATRKNI